MKKRELCPIQPPSNNEAATYCTSNCELYLPTLRMCSFKAMGIKAAKDLALKGYEDDRSKD